MSQLYQMTVTASGVVRDADGNVISSEPIEAVQIVTAEEAQAIQAQIDAANGTDKGESE